MHSLEIVLEAIDFQFKHVLPQVLERNVEDLIKIQPKDTKAINRHPIHRELQDATGMDIRIELYEGAGASVFVPDVDINCPMVNQWRRYFAEGKDSDKLFRKQDVINGYVDMERIRVGGDYSKIPVVINLGLEHINPDSRLALSTREIAAILAHEIGHAFYYFWALGTVIADNYILADAARRLAGVKDKSARLKILNHVCEETDTKITDSEALMKANKEEQCNVLLLKAVVEDRRSTMGEDIYSLRAFEKMADNFASRMGYGREIVTGLDKMFRVFGVDAYKSKAVFHITQIVSTCIVTAVTILAWPMAPVIIAIVLFGNALEDEYDKPKRRFEAMANDLRALLKDRTISANAVKKALADIREIESVTADMNDRDSYLLRLQRFLRPSIRRQSDNMDLQLLLEDMSNNKLFESAAALRQ